MHKKPKVAIIHDYLVQYGGAEKTLEAICQAFPGATVYTGIYNPKAMSAEINRQDIKTPDAGSSFLVKTLPKHLTFLMPILFESFDLDEYDIVISEGTTWAKSVLTKPHQLHISYMHTPPRFLYKYSVESQKRNKWYYKPFVMIIETFLRIWDFSAAQRPDYIIANSHEVQKRIHKFYKRDSHIIYPPVEIDYKTTTKQNPLTKPYYLALGRMAAYKNFDLIIQGFNLLDLPLVIIGTGKEETKLRKMAKSNIQFLGKVSEAEKHAVLENSLGLIFPVVEEDFGITPIEAMAHGKPVLAHGSGGPLETIKNDKSGLFFYSTNTEDFVEKLKEFDEKVKKGFFDPKYIKESTQGFSTERFIQEITAFVTEKWEQHHA